MDSDHGASLDSDGFSSDSERFPLAGGARDRREPGAARVCCRQLRADPPPGVAFGSARSRQKHPQCGVAATETVASAARARISAIQQPRPPLTNRADMNIFFLSSCPGEAAKLQCDARSKNRRTPPPQQSEHMRRLGAAQRGKRGAQKSARALTGAAVPLPSQVRGRAPREIRRGGGDARPAA